MCGVTCFLSISRRLGSSAVVPEEYACMNHIAFAKQKPKVGAHGRSANFTQPEATEGILFQPCEDDANMK